MSEKKQAAPNPAAPTMDAVSAVMAQLAAMGIKLPNTAPQLPKDPISAATAAPYKAYVEGKGPLPHSQIGTTSSGKIKLGSKAKKESTFDPFEYYHMDRVQTLATMPGDTPDVVIGISAPSDTCTVHVDEKTKKAGACMRHQHNVVILGLAKRAVVFPAPQMRDFLNAVLSAGPRALKYLSDNFEM